MVYVFYREIPNNLGRNPVEYRLRLAPTPEKAGKIARSLERSGYKLYFNTYNPTLFDNDKDIATQLKNLRPGFILITQLKP